MFTVNWQSESYLPALESYCLSANGFRKNLLGWLKRLNQEVRFFLPLSTQTVDDKQIFDVAEADFAGLNFMRNRTILFKVIELQKFLDEGDNFWNLEDTDEDLPSAIKTLQDLSEKLLEIFKLIRETGQHRMEGLELVVVNFPMREWRDAVVKYISLIISEHSVPKDYELANTLDGMAYLNWFYPADHYGDYPDDINFKQAPMAVLIRLWRDSSAQLVCSPDKIDIQDVDKIENAFGRYIKWFQYGRQAVEAFNENYMEDCFKERAERQALKAQTPIKDKDGDDDSDDEGENSSAPIQEMQHAVAKRSRPMIEPVDSSKKKMMMTQD